MSGPAGFGPVLLDRLVGARLLVPTGVRGLYGRGGVYEAVVAALEARILELAADQAPEALRYPPVIPRSVFAASGYLDSFPDLMGSVHTFHGDDAAHARLRAAFERGDPIGPLLEDAEVVLCPAICHPVYGGFAGPLAAEVVFVEVSGYCFRHEPSDDPFRMQAFRQHDVVCIGPPETARAFRGTWVERAAELYDDLGLTVSVEVANDPFFGRSGRILAANQRDEELKLELVLEVEGRSSPVAIGSGNCHLDHFSAAYGITLPDGGLAHSACYGFGLDRIAVALFAVHGLDPGTWPPAVRAALGW